MPSAFSYLRFSTPKQAEGDSIRRQTELTAAWCARNKVQLDTSLNLRDEGVSAYRGKHRDNPDTHALAAFVQAVKSGRVPAGSYLIVESLDRLSREKIRPALTLLLNLIEASVKVVQLIPVEMVFDEDVEPMQLMMAVMELNRGHSESAVKSKRISEVWTRKQKEAAPGKIITGKLPCWIRREGERLVIEPSAGKVVRRIVGLAREQGITAIAKRLNDDGTPTLARKKIRGREVKWSAPTIYTLLTSRALVGEYVPYTSTGRGRKPKGKPVPGYFPALISEDEWHAVQSALKTRSHIGRGRHGKHVNLFAGLVRDAVSGRNMTYRHPSNKPSMLVPIGTGDEWLSFPSRVFEACVLGELAELKIEDVEGGENDAAKRVANLSGELRGVENLLTSWAAKMADPLIVDRVAAKLAELEGQRRELSDALAAAQRDASSPVAESLGGLQRLTKLLAEDAGDEMREKVRSAVRRVVDSIHIVVVESGRVKVAAVRVQFCGTGRHRDYLIAYTKRYNGEEPVPPLVTSHAWPTEVGELDLRQPDDARTVEKYLSRVDVPALVAAIRARNVENS